MKERFEMVPDLRDKITIIRNYTEEEKQDFANRAADANQTIVDLEAEKKELVADFNSKIKGARAERDSLTERRAQGFENRREECDGFLEENASGRWEMVFYDSTGLEVLRRPATPNERQTRLKAANE